MSEFLTTLVRIVRSLSTLFTKKDFGYPPSLPHPAIRTLDLPIRFACMLLYVDLILIVLSFSLGRAGLPANSQCRTVMTEAEITLIMKC